MEKEMSSKVQSVKIKATELVWDQTLYPREEVNEQHITNLCYALRMGELLPPLLIERITRRLIDGVHRWYGRRRVFGDDCEIECIIVDFASEQEAYLAAVAANSGHGLRYNGFELTKIALRAEELGITRETLSQAIKIPFEAITRRVITKAGKADVGGVEKFVALKGSMQDLHGRKLTQGQVEANKSAGGMAATYYVNNVITLVEQGLGTKWGTEEARTRLIFLRALLGKKKLSKDE
jgi:hypothetical protein